MTVGASLPGKSFAMAGSEERDACSMMYLLPLTCSTPSIRMNRRRVQSLFSAGIGTGVRMRAAWLSSTTSACLRWLAASVEPVETRPQMGAARPEAQALFLDHIEPDQAEIAHVLLNQIGDVVVAHEQHVERHVLPVAHELMFAAGGVVVA